MVSDETFFAWLDGELAVDEAAAIAAEVAADPVLSRRAADHRALHRRLAHAFGPIAEAEVPEHLAASTRRSEAEVVDLAETRKARSPRRWGSLPQWAAIAATLAVGIFTGTMISGRDSAPVVAQGSRIYAAAALDRALDSELASEPAGGAVRINLTFRDQSGTICRSFTQAAASGLACRDGNRWQVRGLFGAPEGQSGTYRMAAGTDPNLAALVSLTIAGEPFDAAQEKAAKANGWR